jgi:ribose/xylose/arabinose/galactoside ABC-type transport system permease subunit
LSSPACSAWFNGLLVTRFSIQPIIATLVLFIAGRGIAQVMTNGNLQVFKNEGFQFIAMGRVAGIPAQVVLMIIIAAAGLRDDPLHRSSAARSSRSAATKRRRG